MHRVCSILTLCLATLAVSANPPPMRAKHEIHLAGSKQIRARALISSPQACCMACTQTASTFPHD